MPHVNSLSGYPICMMVVNSKFLIRVQQTQQADPEISSLITLVKTTKYERYVVKHGILYEKREDQDLLMIPKGMQTELIRNAHEIGHFSIKKVE